MSNETLTILTDY